MPEGPPDYTEQAQAAAQAEHDALVAMADARFGHAVQAVVGLVTARDAGAQTVTLAGDTGAAWVAGWGGLPVPASVVGQRALCLVDPRTRQAYFRFVV